MLQSIGQIFWCQQGCLLMHTSWMNPKTQDCKIWPQETRDIVLSYGAKHFRYLELFLNYLN